MLSHFEHSHRTAFTLFRSLDDMDSLHILLIPWCGVKHEGPMFKVMAGREVIPQQQRDDLFEGPCNSAGSGWGTPSG